MMDGGMMMDDSSMLMMCVMMGIGALLLIIAIGLTVYMVVRVLMKKRKVEDRPLMVLKERYANGEINDEEFEHKQTLLRK